MNKVALAFVAASWSVSAFASRCEAPNLLEARLTPGQEYEVSPLKTISSTASDRVWLKNSPKRLTFVAKLPGDAILPELFTFADGELNTFYFRVGEAEAFGLTLENLPLDSAAKMTTLLQQNDGSCNLMAQVMAINQARLNKGLSPFELTGRTAEADRGINRHSYFQLVREFLIGLYDLAWPNGYTPGAKSQSTIMAMIQKVNQLKSLMAASNQAAPSLTVGEIQARSSQSAAEFLAHIDSGGTGLVAGLPGLNSKQQVTSSAAGSATEVIFSGLQPYPGFLQRAIRQVSRSITLAKNQSQIIDAIEEGKYPDEAMVMKQARLLTPAQGHAIAAVRTLTEGPLKGTIVMLNSWGTVELYRRSQIKDGMRFLLFK